MEQTNTDKTVTSQESRVQQLRVNIALSGANRLFASCSNISEDTGDVQYGFSLYRDTALVAKLDFSGSPTAVFWLTQTGIYAVVVSAVVGETRLKAYSNHVEYKAAPVILEEPKQEEGPFRSTAHVLREIWQNRDRMLHIAKYDYHVKSKDSYLGKLWEVLSPLIQVFTFWFVFGVGMRRGRAVDGFPYLLWMLCGLFPWFFMSAGIVGGSASIYSKAGMVLRMQYPIATIPMGNILTSFFEHRVLIAILVIVEVCYGYLPSLMWLNLLYYWVYAIFFLTALSLVTSTLTMIARDYLKLINSLIRLLFYMTPILWTLDSMPHFAQVILQANPILYVVNGYRDSLLYGIPFWDHRLRILFFWGVAIALFILGSWMHRKERDRFIDLL